MRHQQPRRYGGTTCRAHASARATRAPRRERFGDSASATEPRVVCVPPIVYASAGMKYAIIIPDGAADEPLKELGGKTPIEAAHTPYMDQIAMAGTQGTARTVPDGFES